MAKLIIVGGGIAGLSAGIFALENGFKVEIYEKNKNPGGECTGWSRGGYHFDNCINYLEGVSKKSLMYEVWNQLCDFENVNIKQFENLSGFSKDGKRLLISKDLDKLKENMINISKDDEDEIIKFINTIEKFKKVDLHSYRTKEINNIFSYIPYIHKIRRLKLDINYFKNISLDEYLSRFNSEIIRNAFLNIVPPGNVALTLFELLGNYYRGNIGWPEGGSLRFSLCILKRFKKLGGKIVYNTKVESIEIKDGVCKGVVLEKGKKVSSDYVISAIDAHYLLSTLLDNKYKDKLLNYQFNNLEKFPLFSSVNIHIGVKCDLSNYYTSMTYDTEPFMVGNEIIDKLSVKHYCFEKSFADEGKSVLGVNILGDFYDYFKELRELSYDKYKEEKEQIAEEVIGRLKEIYPQIIDKIDCYDVCTPLTFERYCGAYKGSWKAFVHNVNGKLLHHNGRIEGVKNLYIAGQWTYMPGGLSNAALSGKYAVQRLCKDNNIKFNNNSRKSK